MSHWEDTYATTTEAERSWSQDDAVTSLSWITASGVGTSQSVVDIGGGASRLVDGLVAAGYERVTVVDLSPSALAEAKARVGNRAEFVERDLFSWSPSEPVSLWHDRAVLHFLTSPQLRMAYGEKVARSVRIGGAVVIACFSHLGPERCSNLEVERASADDLAKLFGERFRLEESATLLHTTPWGSTQSFTWVRLTFLGEKRVDADGEAKLH